MKIYYRKIDFRKCFKGKKGGGGGGVKEGIFVMRTWRFVMAYR